MVRRPTAGWREHVAAELFPEEMLDRTDEVLTAFEADVAALVEQRWEPATDTEIFEVIERTVRALNAVNDRHDGAAYETDERERLCAYIEGTLDEAGIDVDAFARPPPDDPARDHRRVA
nr:hypothetical protein GCM10020092_101720 [Actinoplanes digitatis]